MERHASGAAEPSPGNPATALTQGQRKAVVSAIRREPGSPRQSTVRTSVRVQSSEATSEKLPAVFFDRDGTLMHDPGYCSAAELVQAIEGARDALLKLKAAGFVLIVITNQSGIGRGLITTDQYHAVARELDRQLGEGLITQTYFCPSRPEDNDPRRKPSPQMVFEAIRDHGIDVQRSWFVGDKTIDSECGRRAGLRTILVQTGYGHVEEKTMANHVVPTVAEAAELILAQMKRPRARLG